MVDFPWTLPRLDRPRRVAWRAIDPPSASSNVIARARASVLRVARARRRVRLGNACDWGCYDGTSQGQADGICLRVVSGKRRKRKCQRPKMLAERKQRCLAYMDCNGIRELAGTDCKRGRCQLFASTFKRPLLHDRRMLYLCRKSVDALVVSSFQFNPIHFRCNAIQSNPPPRRSSPWQPSSAHARSTSCGGEIPSCRAPRTAHRAPRCEMLAVAIRNQSRVEEVRMPPAKWSRPPSEGFRRDCVCADVRC